MSDSQADLWTAVRLMAEGSDWKRDQGETLTAWAQRTLRAAQPETGEITLTQMAHTLREAAVVLRENMQSNLGSDCLYAADAIERISRTTPQLHRPKEGE